MLGLFGYLVARDLRRAVNKSSSASDPVGLTLSDRKLKRLCPTLYFATGVGGASRCFLWDGLFRRCYIHDILAHGDSRAAVVLTADPLRVACYCDDLDGVCVLRFPPELAADYGLHAGDRLLTVLNSAVTDPFHGGRDLAPDLVQGAKANPRYVNFWPLVTEFFSDETPKLAGRKAQISAAEWHRCLRMGEELLRRFGGAARDGRPDRSFKPVGGRWRRDPW